MKQENKELIDFEDLALTYLVEVDKFKYYNDKVKVLAEIFRKMFELNPENMLKFEKERLEEDIIKKKEELKDIEQKLKWYKENYLERWIVVNAIFKWWHTAPNLTMLLKELCHNKIELSKDILNEQHEYKILSDLLTKEVVKKLTEKIKEKDDNKIIEI